MEDRGHPDLLLACPCGGIAIAGVLIGAIPTLLVIYELSGVAEGVRGRLQQPKTLQSHQ